MGSPKVSDVELAAIVAQSKNITEVCTAIAGRPVAKSTHSHWSRRIKAANIPTQHFERASNLHRHVTSPEKTLVDHTGTPYRTPASKLRWALQAIGRPYICEGCNGEPRWQGQPLVLQVDHKNGNNKDDRANNLRFLCPNCHSQTGTFGSRNGKSKSWVEGFNERKRTERLALVAATDLTKPGALLGLLPALGVKHRSSVSTWLSRHCPDASIAKARKIQRQRETAVIIQALCNSGIEFDKYGWATKAAAIIGVTPQKAAPWLKREAPEFYEKCFRRCKQSEAITT